MQLYKLYSINSTMYWQKHKNKKFRNKDSFSLIFPVIFRITFLVFWSLEKKNNILTWGFSATYLAQFLISRMASILVSGKAALQANSERHFTASWNESMMDAKCFSHMLAINRLKKIQYEEKKNPQAYYACYVILGLYKTAMKTE